MTQRQAVYNLLAGLGDSLDEPVFRALLGLLRRVGENALNNPADERFRSLRRANPALAVRLFVAPEVDRVLLLSGFEEREGVFSLPDRGLTEISDLVVIVEALELELDTQASNALVDPLEAERRRNLQDDEQRAKEAEIRRIAEQAMRDRREVESAQALQPPVDSRARQLRFGATLRTCGDLGIGKPSNNR